MLAWLMMGALAAEVEEVPAATISALPEQYEGKRVRTELSLMALMPRATGKMMGCKKDDTAFMLGPKMEMGKPPKMLAGTWGLCANVETTKQLTTLDMGTGIVIEATLEVSGPKVARRITMAETTIVETKPLTP